MEEPRRWTSSSPDLRWRTTAGNRKSSAASTNANRGFVEDYGEEQASKRVGGRFAGPLLSVWRWCRHNCTAALLCAAAVASSALSATVIQTNLVMVASSLSVLLSFVILLQRRKLRRLGTLRHQNNEIRRHANYFRQERERLHRTLDRLDETVADLHSVPHELHRLTKNRNLDRMLQIVKEQKEIQEQMRNKINQQVMQQILEVVMREDRDKDWTLRPTEIEALIVRLGLNPMVEINEHKFREMLLMAPNVTTVMQLLRALLERDDEYEHSDSVFRIKANP
jgi:hypothetical protein